MADKNNIRELIKQLRAFNQIDTKMQVSTILTLLEIAKAEASREECSVQQIESNVGLKSGTASRNVYYWSDRGPKDMPHSGYGFITVTFDPEDRRKRSLLLSAKGRAFINNL